MSDLTPPADVSALPPLEPQPDGPSEDWKYIALYKAVHNALFALPSYFKTNLNISGVPATDLHTFNTSLGATIESQAVETLNQMRTIWDPTGQYALYNFVRQAQKFPDVILRSSAPDMDPPIILGIELKGWYILAKEGEPSYRYRVTPAVCAPCDLLVVYPWALTDVISGSPRLFEPYVTSARFAALYRNWHWQYKKSQRDSGKNEIKLSSVSHFYPAKSDEIVDLPDRDAGSNFGRFARTGLMDAYMASIFKQKLSGIPISAWRRFLSIFSEDWNDADVTRGLKRIAEEIAKGKLAISDMGVQEVKLRLEEITQLLSADIKTKLTPQHETKN